MFLKSFLTVGMFALASASAYATDISVFGKSGEFIYGQLWNRSEGIKKSESKSLLGSLIQTTSLYEIMNCSIKYGWISDSYSCSLPGTDSADIQGQKVVAVGDDEMNDALEGLNQSINRETVVSFGGISASRIYSKLSQLEGKDKTFYKNEGVTRFFKSPFVGFGIDELYCKKTTGKILGNSFRCFLSNATVADSNAKTVVLKDPE